MHCNPILQKVFWYSLEVKYLDLSSDGDYVTIPLWHNILTCVFTEGHMYQLGSAFYVTENINWLIPYPP